MKLLPQLSNSRTACMWQYLCNDKMKNNKIKGKQNLFHFEDVSGVLSLILEKEQGSLVGEMQRPHLYRDINTQPPNLTVQRAFHNTIQKRQRHSIPLSRTLSFYSHHSYTHGCFLVGKTQVVAKYSIMYFNKRPVLLTESS